MTVELVPYRGFKERLQLIKELKKQKCNIEIFNDYLYITKQTVYKDGSVY